MELTITNVKEAAKKFLAIADELNEKVSNYINGSDDKNDEEAYRTVCEAEKLFIDTANSYYNEKWECGLNYELAESFIYL